MNTYDDYTKEIKKLGEWLIKHADDIILTETDYKNKLRSISLYAKLSYGDIPTWDINKEYFTVDDKIED